MGSRISFITTRLLIESIINYGKSAYGAHRSILYQDRIDAVILNGAAKKIIGAGPTVSWGVMHIPAHTRSFFSHQTLKAANVADRALRA